jgi:hypothetical protein
MKNIGTIEISHNRHLIESPLEPGPFRDARQQLINRVVASREFAHAHKLKRILQYLCQRAQDSVAVPPKEYEIAMNAMGRREDFDPRTDPIVRVSIASIRDRLTAYFAGEGQHEPIRLTIPKGQYLVHFSDNGRDTASAESTAAALMKFWRPYFTGYAANIIVYTEPLFFRDEHGHYLRDWFVNDQADGVEQLLKRLPLAGLGPLHASYHYLSAGEVHCMQSISRMFHEMHVPVEMRNSRISSWKELKNSNLILLGSPRTNDFLSSLLGGEPFTITSSAIENLQPAAAEQPRYEGHRYMDGKLMRMTEYALVTRRPGLTPGCVVTTIAANHGRAIEGAGQFLTLEDRVRTVVTRLRLGEANEPEHFQLLMRVGTIDVDDEVAQSEVVTHRVI